MAGTPLFPAEEDFVRDEFAPAHFKQMSQDDTLKSPSFENYKSGVRVRGSDELTLNHSVTRDLEYESFVIDMQDPTAPLVTVPVDSVPIPGDWGPVEGGGGSVSHHPYATVKKASKFFKHQVALNDNSKPQFVIANLSNLTQVDQSVTYASFEEAQQEMQQLVLTNPALDGEVQIISGQTSGLQQPG